MFANQIPAFQKALLAWYQKNARDLPWRRTKNPYAIWVSEIMLQQTQVKTVIPYYLKWMNAFPSIKHLAQAPVETVLNYWAGLGYYRRARMLHQAAKMLVSQQSTEWKTQNGKTKISEPATRYAPGTFPSELSALMKIPGIGRYTAGAIASIAFEKKVPILDGNVIRILTRLNAVREDTGLPKTIGKLWDMAEKILPDKKIGDFNQALMELGATVCFPQNPSCLLCPVNAFCEAVKGNPEKFPVKNKKEKSEILETAALILRNKNKFLLQKQPAGGRWGGLWMFPHWIDQKSMLQETGFKKKDLLRRMTVKHGFTKYRITLTVYEPKTPPSAKRREYGAKKKPDAWIAMRSALHTSQNRWVYPSELSSLPFPAPHQKIVSEIFKDA